MDSIPEHPLVPGHRNELPTEGFAETAQSQVPKPLTCEKSSFSFGSFNDYPCVMHGILNFSESVCFRGLSGPPSAVVHLIHVAIGLGLYPCVQSKSNSLKHPFVARG